MSNKDKQTLVKGSWFVVRIGFVANRFFLAGVALGLLLSWIFPAQFAALLIEPNPGVDVRADMTGLRLLMLVGIAMAVAADRLFAALAEIIASARAGDPFISANARRLQTIGWPWLHSS
jgi:hypothetical protein